MDKIVRIHEGNIFLAIEGPIELSKEGIEMGRKVSRAHQ
jgi:hypothetical protein